MACSASDNMQHFEKTDEKRMNNQNKMNWITYRLIHQNKATKLRLQYLYINRATCVVTESKRRIDYSFTKPVSSSTDSLKQKRIYRRIEHTNISLAFSSLRTYFLPGPTLRIIFMNCTESWLVQRSIHYQFPHWEHICLGEVVQGNFSTAALCTNCFFNLPPNISSFTCCNGPEKTTLKSWRWCMRLQAFEIIQTPN